MQNRGPYHIDNAILFRASEHFGSIPFRPHELQSLMRGIIKSHGETRFRRMMKALSQVANKPKSSWPWHLDSTLPELVLESDGRYRFLITASKV